MIANWLLDTEANPVILFDVYHSDGVIRLASQSFISSPDSAKPNRVYDDLIKENMLISASIGANRSVGEIDFYALEDQHALDFTHYESFIGDAGWDIDEFEPLSAGSVEQVTRPERSVCRLSFSDPSSILQNSISSDNLPLALGNVFNASPIVKDAANLIYTANTLSCSITQVRDNGVPVVYTDNNNGTFTLSAMPVGQITCDISEPHNIVELACEYLASLKNIELSSLVNFEDFQNTAKIGYFTNSNDDIYSVINEIAASIGAFPRFNELGEFELVHMPHSGAAEIAFYTDDVWMDGFSQQSVIDAANIELTYKKNYTTQSSVSGAALNNSALFAKANSTINIDNSAANTQTINTCLSSESDAQTEAQRRASLWANKREIWDFSVVMQGMLVKIGDRVSVSINEVIAKTGTITGWSKRPDRKEAKIEVMLNV